MRIKIVRSIPINGIIGKTNFYMPPLGMARIYTHLKNRGFDITQKDLLKTGLGSSFFYSLTMLRLFRYLRNTNKLDELLGSKATSIGKELRYYIKAKDLADVDVLLISVFSCPFSSVFGIIVAKYYKSIKPNGVVVAGGEWLQTSFIYDHFDLYSALGIIDYYIDEYGELPVEMLLRYLDNEPIDRSKIPGLSYRAGEKVVRNDFTYVQKPFLPLFDGLHLEKYQWHGCKIFNRLIKSKNKDSSIFMLPVQSISGCLNNCAFCGYSETKCSALSPVEAVDNLEYLSRKYNTKYFFFMDSTINISYEYVKGFCDEIIRRNLEIYWTSCASFGGLEDENIFKLMRRSGACRLIYGLESGSQRMLNYINKKIEADHAARCLRWSCEAGIWTDLEIIAGMPFEEEKDIDLTTAFLDENKAYIDTVWLNRFFLSCGSAMYNRPADFGIENIRKKDHSSEIDHIVDYRYRFSFDEINGLEWSEKEKQIEYSYCKLQHFLSRNGLTPCYDTAKINVLLLYLYSCAVDKEQIKNCLKYYYAEFKAVESIRNSIIKLSHLYGKVFRKTLENPSSPY